MPTNPRTRLPPTWTLLVASTLAVAMTYGVYADDKILLVKRDIGQGGIHMLLTGNLRPWERDFTFRIRFPIMPLKR